MSDDFHETLLKTSRKKKVSYSVDEELLKEFDIFSKARKLKKSQIVEKMIRAFVKQEKILFN